MAATHSVPAYERFTIASAAVGETRTITVYPPATSRASDPALPVLYMPDGGIDIFRNLEGEALAFALR